MKDEESFRCQMNPTLENTPFDDTHDDDHYDEDEYEISVDDDDMNEDSEHEPMNEAEKDEIKKDIRVLTSFSEPLRLRNYANGKDIDEKSPHTIVIDRTGKEFKVRKSSLCWLFSQDRHSMSSDRLVRVQESDLVKQSRGEIKSIRK